MYKTNIVAILGLSALCMFNSVKPIELNGITEVEDGATPKTYVLNLGGMYQLRCTKNRTDHINVETGRVLYSFSGENAEKNYKTAKSVFNGANGSKESVEFVTKFTEDQKTAFRLFSAVKYNLLKRSLYHSRTDDAAFGKLTNGSAWSYRSILIFNERGLENKTLQNEYFDQNGGAMEIQNNGEKVFKCWGMGMNKPCEESYRAYHEAFRKQVSLDNACREYENAKKIFTCPDAGYPDAQARMKYASKKSQKTK